MTDILDEIIRYKRKELEAQKENCNIDYFVKNMSNRKVISMKDALASSNTGIISEFKRRSPSKSWINKNADAEIIPLGYEKSGATALSILSDEHFFGGKLDDIIKARKSVSLPILRKDFIIDEYQLYQAKCIGADAVLLIAAALEKKKYSFLLQKAHELDLEVLLEIHDENELDYISDEVDLVGVNNRNLGTFDTNVENSKRLINYLPKSKVLISESGISKPDIVCELRELGFKGFLIGENFMRAENPALELKKFIQEIC